MATILVTNDDGIDSPGLHALVEALDGLGTIQVIAPDRNRSAVARSITLGQHLWVEERSVPGATAAFASDGTPTDCVRFAGLGLLGCRPDLVVSGANHGLNLGDDVTYSGTVAAAFEGLLLGIPAVAVSQQSLDRETGYKSRQRYDFSAMQAFMRNLVAHLLERLQESDQSSPTTMLNVNVPGLPRGQVRGARVGRLGRRIYRDRLNLQSEDGCRRIYSLYGDDPSHHEEDETDFAAIADDCIAVTPIHYDLTARQELEELARWPLAQMLSPTRGD